MDLNKTQKYVLVITNTSILRDEEEFYLIPLESFLQYEEEFNIVFDLDNLISLERKMWYRNWLQPYLISKFDNIVNGKTFGYLMVDKHIEKVSLLEAKLKVSYSKSLYV